MNLLLLDVDGVLTDGGMYVSGKGERFKRFHSRDNRAIAQFTASGWEVHFVTASGWPGLGEYFNNVPAFLHIDNPKSQADINQITGGRPYYACGDDAFDLEKLSGASRAFCPKDSDDCVRNLRNVETLLTDGGQGVVAELARTLL